MSLQRIDLNKKVYNNKDTIDTLNTPFSDLIKSENIVDVSLFFQFYRDLFYKIPKDGEHSHQTLIKKSQSYTGTFLNDLDKEIADLTEEIGRLQSILDGKMDKLLDGGDIYYPNGTFLRSPFISVEQLPIWVMQRGVKREIKNYNTYLSLKRAFGFAYDEDDDNVCTDLSTTVLDSILDAPTEVAISDDPDINIISFEPVDLDITLGGLVDYIKAEIYCVEGQDPSWTGMRVSNRDGEVYSGRGYVDILPVPSSLGDRQYIKDNGCYYRVPALDSNPGEIRMSSRRLFPGESHITWYRKTDSNGGLEDVKGYMLERRILDSKLMGEGTWDKPPSGGDNSSPDFGRRHYNGDWKDNNGNLVIIVYDLPSVPYFRTVRKKSDYGIYMIQPSSRETDHGWRLSYYDHEWQHTHGTAYGSTHTTVQSHLWKQVLNNTSDPYYFSTNELNQAQLYSYTSNIINNPYGNTTYTDDHPLPNAGPLPSPLYNLPIYFYPKTKTYGGYSKNLWEGSFVVDLGLEINNQEIAADKRWLYILGNKTEHWNSAYPPRRETSGHLNRRLTWVYDSSRSIDVLDNIFGSRSKWISWAQNARTGWSYYVDRIQEILNDDNNVTKILEFFGITSSANLAANIFSALSGDANWAVDEMVWATKSNGRKVYPGMHEIRDYWLTQNYGQGVPLEWRKRWFPELYSGAGTWQNPEGQYLYYDWWSGADPPP